MFLAKPQRLLPLSALSLALNAFGPGPASAEEAQAVPGFTGRSAAAALALTPAAASANPLAASVPAPGQISCAVRALREVKLAAPVHGVIAEVAVRPGQKVQPGDLIARFDTEIGTAELALALARAGDQTALETAAARVEGLNARLHRLERALKSRAVSESEVEIARLELAVARGEEKRARADLHLAGLEVERARLTLRKAEVHSPVAGTVGEALIDAGEAPDAQQPIAVITVTDPLRIEAWVPAREVPAFLARSSFEAVIGTRPYALTFDYAAPMADISSGTISVFFTLEAPDLLPGLECLMRGEGALSEGESP